MSGLTSLVASPFLSLDYKFPHDPGKSIKLGVCVFSSHSFWTSSSLDVPAGVTQEEGHTGFLIHLLSAVRALIFLARRIQPFLSLVDREVEFCVLTSIPDFCIPDFFFHLRLFLMLSENAVEKGPFSILGKMTFL